MSRKNQPLQAPTTTVVGELLSTKQAAALIGVKPGALVDWRYRGWGPPYLRISRRLVRYSEHSLRQWLAQHVQLPAA